MAEIKNSPEKEKNNEKDFISCFGTYKTSYYLVGEGWSSSPGEYIPTDPDTTEKPEEPNWFVRIWNAILDFFRRLFGIKKRK